MSILDFIFPPKCKICNIKVKRGAVCPFCFDKLKETMKPSYFTITVDGRSTNVRYLFLYKNATVQSLFFALKKQANRELFVFAAQLYGGLVDDSENTFAVINVPRSKENVKKYGYDHVKNPCRIMCKDNEKLVFAPILKRKAFSDEQKNLTAAQRRKNVENKFYAVKKDIPKNILLVDDIVTTSSTMCECIKELYKVYPNATITCISLAYTNGLS